MRKGGRKTRYVFVLPATLTLESGGGKLGTLARMDTETPVLYIEFPQVCVGGVVWSDGWSFLPVRWGNGGV